MNHPNSNDGPQGSSVESLDSGSGFVSIVWHGYAPATGEYSAVKAEWSYDEENKLIFLEWVGVKYPYQKWNDFLTNPANAITDRHFRLVREFAAKHFEMEKFRLRTRLHPKNE